MAKNVPPGPGIDSSGQSVVDPTKNVKAILKSAVQRQDDLRRVEFKGIRSEVHLEISSLHSELRDFKSFIRKINDAETKRIDAIRAVDQANVVVANSAAENRATTLAKQVTDTAIAATVSLKAETDPIRKSIDELRQSQWTIAGGTRQEAETKTDSQTKNANWGLWVGVGTAVLFGLGTLFLSFVSLVVAIFFTTKGLQ